MSWKDQIQAGNTVWHGIEGYVAERVAEMTNVCVAPESSDADIRRAQASIIELNRLLSLPDLIRAEAQIRGQMTKRKEY